MILGGAKRGKDRRGCTHVMNYQKSPFRSRIRVMDGDFVAHNSAYIPGVLPPCTHTRS